MLAAFHTHSCWQLHSIGVCGTESVRGYQQKLGRSTILWQMETLLLLGIPSLSGLQILTFSVIPAGVSSDLVGSCRFWSTLGCSYGVQGK